MVEYTVEQMKQIQKNGGFAPHIHWQWAGISRKRGRRRHRMQLKMRDPFGKEIVLDEFIPGRCTRDGATDEAVARICKRNPKYIEGFIGVGEIKTLVEKGIIRVTG